MSSTDRKNSSHQPEEWRLAKLMDVCSFKHGGTPSKSNPSFWGGQIPWISPKDMHVTIITESQDHITEEAISNSNTNLIPKDTILIVVRSGILSHEIPIAITGDESSFNQDIKAILPDRDKLSTWYLYWSIKAQEQKILLNGIKKGATVHSFKSGFLESLEIPIAPLSEQKRIENILNIRMAAITRARVAAEAQLNLLDDLVHSYLRYSLFSGTKKTIALGDCLIQISKGLGASWSEYPVIGATRAGAAPAKENVGKNPERYKFVEEGTIFYNPMRILLGSIAMIDDGELPGITSPDYVVFKTKPGILHSRWFYFWLRSRYGKDFIKTLARGAVRERMLFRRLSNAEINIPSWDLQLEIANRFKAISIAKIKLSAQLDLINQLPSAILRQTFSGVH